MTARRSRHLCRFNRPKATSVDALSWKSGLKLRYMILACSEEMDNQLTIFPSQVHFTLLKKLFGFFSLADSPFPEPKVTGSRATESREAWFLAVSGIFLDLLRLSSSTLTMHIERLVLYDTGLT